MRAIGVSEPTLYLFTQTRKAANFYQVTLPDHPDSWTTPWSKVTARLSSQASDSKKTKSRDTLCSPMTLTASQDLSICSQATDKESLLSLQRP